MGRGKIEGGKAGQLGVIGKKGKDGRREREEDTVEDLRAGQAADGE